MKLKLETTCVLALSAAIFAAGSSRGSEVTPENDAEIAATFDIPKDAEELLLPVTFRGETFLFLLDTGSDLTIYDGSFRQHFGQAIRTSRIKTPNGEMRVDLFNSPDAKLGKLDMQTPLPIMCMDLSKIRQVTGNDIYGIVGMDFLRDHVVQIDVARGRVSFLRSAQKDAGRPVRIFYHSLHPRVVMNVAGIAATFMIDTGCSHSGNLESSLFDRLVERQKIREIGSTQSTTLSGIKQWRDGRLAALSLDEFTHRNLVVTEAQGNQLGLAYLLRFVVTFDFPNATMYLKPSRRYDTVDRRDMSGLHILQEAGRIEVHSVDEGSPAALAGIQPKDVITMMAGRRSNHYTLSDLRRMLTQNGTQIAMTISHGGETKQVNLRLDEWRRNVAARPKVREAIGGGGDFIPRSATRHESPRRQ